MMHDSGAELGGYVFTVLLLIVPVWRIFRRAGLYPALSLLMFVPGVGMLVVALLLAFLRWPGVARS